jgi:hypothetical protein
MAIPNRLAILGFGLLSALFLAGRARAATADELEYQVKAAFLYNFAKFVEWPEDAFEGPTDPMILCVVGDDPFGESLDTVVHGETLNGRPLVVHRTRDLYEIRDCHVVFVPRSERGRQERILEDLRNRGILTVGEADGFLTGGGIIRFVLEQNKVRFDINLQAAESSGLELSSKLLRLARTIHTPSAGQREMP